MISEIFLELLQPMEEEHTIVHEHRCGGILYSDYISRVKFLDFTGSPGFSDCLFICFKHGNFIVR